MEVHGADGVNVAVFVDELYEIEPAATVPSGLETTIEVPVTAWLKVTETVELSATLVAPEEGVRELTVGRAAVVKFHETGVIAALPTEAAPDTVTV